MTQENTQPYGNGFIVITKLLYANVYLLLLSYLMDHTTDSQCILQAW